MKNTLWIIGGVIIILLLMIMFPYQGLGVILALLMLATQISAMFGFDKLLTKEAVKRTTKTRKGNQWTETLIDKLLDNSSYVFGKGAQHKTDKTSHRANWPVTPTGLNSRYYFWLSVTLLVLLYLVPWFLEKHGFTGRFQTLYFCIIAIYFTLSALDWDKNKNVESEEPTDASRGSSDSRGGSGFDVVTTSWRPYVRMSERGLIYFLGTQICEVSGAQWFFLPAGIFSVDKYPKRLIQREITLDLRLNALHDLDEEGKPRPFTAEEKASMAGDPLCQPQNVEGMRIAYGLAIPRGQLARFAAKLDSIAATVKIANDTARAKVAQVAGPLTPKTFSEKRELIARMILEAFEERFLEPTLDGKRKVEDSRGIDVDYVEITGDPLSAEVTNALHTSAAAPAKLKTELLGAQGEQARAKATAAGPLQAITESIKAQLLLLGCLDDKGEVKEGKHELAEELLKQLIQQQTVKGMDLTNINIGGSVGDLLEKLIPTKA